MYQYSVHTCVTLYCIISFIYLENDNSLHDPICNGRAEVITLLINSRANLDVVIKLVPHNFVITQNDDVAPPLYKVSYLYIQ